MTNEKMIENGWEYVRSMNGRPMFKKLNGDCYEWATLYNEEMKAVTYEQVRGFEPFDFDKSYGAIVGRALNI